VGDLEAHLLYVATGDPRLFWTVFGCFDDQVTATQVGCILDAAGDQRGLGPAAPWKAW